MKLRKNFLWNSVLFVIFCSLMYSCSTNYTKTSQDSYNQQLTKEILAELNRVRTNPKQYADAVLKPMLAKFNGNIYDSKLRTNEGVAPVKECIDELQKLSSLPKLTLAKGLCMSAQWLADDQARTGCMGHYGSDGSTPSQRMNKYGKWQATSGENCAYGSKTAVEIVAQLLIDDGVSDRGHRKNILKSDFKVVGIGFSGKQNAKYGFVSVMDFAGGYIDK